MTIRAFKAFLAFCLVEERKKERERDQLAFKYLFSFARLLFFLCRANDLRKSIAAAFKL